MNELSTEEIHATLTKVVCNITLQDAWGGVMISFCTCTISHLSHAFF